ncbi:MAG: archease [Deltaproteobacteria bacterium]|nr:MAG: archease [Deltaproteobacteria bacterium]
MKLGFEIMNATDLNYQIIDHTADLGIVVKGVDVEDVFIRAAYAMTDLMVKADISEKGGKRKVLVEGEDFPDLMVRWLSEILYLFDGEHILVSAIEINSISPIRLRSTLTVVPLKRGHHEILREIKAVTYHQISVRRIHDGWEARIIFDI